MCLDQCFPKWGPGPPGGPQRTCRGVYIIEVSDSLHRWTVKHRYSDFHELHEKLTAENKVDRRLLPPKKILGKNSKSLVERRQKDLEQYLQTLLVQFPQATPPALSCFLHLQLYEVNGVTAALAEDLFHKGEQLLEAGQVFTLRPLQLYSVTQQLRLATPTCFTGDAKTDLGHILDFTCRLKYLKISGAQGPVGSSNIQENSLPFDLSIFKSLLQIEITECSSQQISGLSSLRQTLATMSVHHSTDSMQLVLVPEASEFPQWEPEGAVSSCPVTAVIPVWKSLTTLDLSHNDISAVDSSVKLIPKVEFLDLSHNQLSSVENLQHLYSLVHVDLSYNLLCSLDAAHTRLGNIKTLGLSGNQLSSLQGLCKLYSLVNLDLSHNQLTQLEEIRNIGSLPCLEKLNLSDNPMCIIPDYRTKVLAQFGDRAAEVCLDGKTTTEKELDTVEVLKAIQKAKDMKDRKSNSSSSERKVQTCGTWAIEYTQVSWKLLLKVLVGCWIILSSSTSLPVPAPPLPVEEEEEVQQVALSEQVQVCKAVWCCCLQMKSEEEETGLIEGCLVLTDKHLGLLFLSHDFSPTNQDAGMGADSEELRQLLWLSVVLYKSPEVELTCLLLLSTNAVYFLLEDSEHSNNTDYLVLCCCLSISLSHIHSVNVGLFDQYFRIQGSSGEQVVCCMSRDSYATGQFLQELMSVLSLQQRAPPPEPSEQDFYSQFNTSGKMQNYELVHSRVKFIYPSEEEMGDLTFIVAERKNGCSSSSRSFNILLYLLVFQVHSPGSLGSSGPVLQPRTLILTSTDVFLLDEDYVSYPLPDFAKEPPSRERYHLRESRRIRDLDRVLLGYQTYPQALTLVFDELPGPDLLCPLSMDHFSAQATPAEDGGSRSAGAGAYSGEVQWCVFVPSADSRERLISLLARQWEMLCSRELPVELTG
uniref:Nischarin n=1 Tax=Neogobius melanostomus TaxID=47308 RepID=A0A8C6SWT1_9GOBI